MAQKKLFEYLAIEKDVSKTSQEAISKAMEAFFAPEEMLLGFDVEAVKIREDMPEIQGEHKPLPTTVAEILKSLVDKVGAFIDVTANKENANRTAASDVMIDNQVFLQEWGATALLNLESRLDDLLKIYEAIPTLSFSYDWEWDGSKGCWVSDKRKQIRNVKTTDVIVKYDATKEHPAQTELVTLDRPAYNIEKVMYSGAVPLTEKEEWISRIKKLKNAVTQARQRANTVEVTERNVADKIFDYIHSK